MLGKLIQVATETVTSAVGFVDLIGTTTDDVYMVAFNNVQPSTDTTQLICRVLVSGTPDTSSTYDRAWKQMSRGGANNDLGGTNESFSYIAGAQSGTNTEETNQGILYLYNFNKSTSRSFVTVQGLNRNQGGTLFGLMGGFTHRETQSCNGLRIFFASGNIASGTFTLYKIQ